MALKLQDVVLVFLLLIVAEIFLKPSGGNLVHYRGEIGGQLLYDFWAYPSNMVAPDWSGYVIQKTEYGAVFVVLPR